MKKKTVMIHWFVLLMLVATFAACASTHKHQSTAGEYLDDSVITTKIKALLAKDDFLKAFEIGVETYQGTVQLSGFVDSQKSIDKAEQITKGVSGVKSVKNNLIVK